MKKLYFLIQLILITLSVNAADISPRDPACIGNTVLYKLNNISGTCIYIWKTDHGAFQDFSNSSTTGYTTDTQVNVTWYDNIHNPYTRGKLWVETYQCKIDPRGNTVYELMEVIYLYGTDNQQGVVIDRTRIQAVGSTTKEIAYGATCFDVEVAPVSGSRISSYTWPQTLPTGMSYEGGVRPTGAKARICVTNDAVGSICVKGYNSSCNKESNEVCFTIKRKVEAPSFVVEWNNGVQVTSPDFICKDNISTYKTNQVFADDMLWTVTNGLRIVDDNNVEHTSLAVSPTKSASGVKIKGIAYNIS